MIYPSADKLESWGNKYALATLAAKRAKQIKSGAPSMIDTDSRNPLTIALEEIAAGKITCEVPDVDILATAAVEPEVAQLLSLPDDFDEEADELTAGAAPSHDDEASLEEEEEEEEEDEDHAVWPLAFESEEDEAEAETLAPVDEDEEVAAAPVDLVDDIEDVDEATDEAPDEGADSEGQEPVEESE